MLFRSVGDVGALVGEQVFGIRPALVFFADELVGRHLDDLTVVLLTDEAGLQRLQERDADFLSLFGVSLRCAQSLEHTVASEKAFTRWIAGLVARDHRLPLTAAAVQALICDSARRAAKSGALSLAQDALTQVLAEAHAGALLAEDKVIDAGHIQHVFAQRASRATRGTAGMAVRA